MREGLDTVTDDVPLNEREEKVKRWWRWCGWFGLGWSAVGNVCVRRRVWHSSLSRLLFFSLPLWDVKRKKKGKFDICWKKRKNKKWNESSRALGWIGEERWDEQEDERWGWMFLMRMMRRRGIGKKRRCKVASEPVWLLSPFPIHLFGRLLCSIWPLRHSCSVVFSLSYRGSFSLLSFSDNLVSLYFFFPSQFHFWLGRRTQPSDDWTSLSEERLTERVTGPKGGQR